MKLFELFVLKEKSLSPEERRLRIVLSVLANRMKQDDFPSHLSWAQISKVLERSNIPFSEEEVRAFIDDKLSDTLSMDDRGSISVAEPADMEPTDIDQDDMDMDMDMDGTDSEIEPGSPAPDTVNDFEEPVTDVNATDKMAKRALKRRMG